MGVKDIQKKVIENNFMMQLKKNINIVHRLLMKLSKIYMRIKRRYFHKENILQLLDIFQAKMKEL